LKIFLDTSALVAYYNIDDRNHAKAREVVAKIEKGEVPLTRFYISDYVFDETVTFIRCVLHQHELALSVGEALQSSPFTTIVWVDEGVFREAWDLFKRRGECSFTDCTSFALMKRMGIQRAFTFDAHFREAGFEAI